MDIYKGEGGVLDLFGSFLFLFTIHLVVYLASWVFGLGCDLGSLVLWARLRFLYLMRFAIEACYSLECWNSHHLFEHHVSPFSCPVIPVFL